MKSLIVPALLLAYLGSQWLAPRLWGWFFDQSAERLDLSPSQTAALWPLLHSIVLLMALPQVIASLRKAE